MFKFGFELEGFYTSKGEIQLPPRNYPTDGHPVSVPGYGYNNGYYSANLTLVLGRPDATTKFDISECQDIKD